MEQGTPPYPDHFRAGDSDRQKVADQLRAALDDGRLTLTEYDDRLGAAYAAQTFGQLAELTRDLPNQDQKAVVPAPVEQPPAKREGQSQLVRRGAGWVSGVAVMTGIWGVQSFTDAAPGVHFFWPAFPLAFWAMAVFGGGHRHHRTRDSRDPQRRHDT